MEASLHSSLLRRASKAEESVVKGHDQAEDKIVEVGAGNRANDGDEIKEESATPKNLACSRQMEQLQLVKAEMNEVMEENNLLRMRLNQMLTDYRVLESQYRDIAQQEESKKYDNARGVRNDQTEEPGFISLRLGTSSSETPKEVPCKVPASEGDNGELTLGLDCKFELPEALSRVDRSSPASSPEKGPGEPWPPNKIAKNPREGGDDEILQQNAAKRARVSVRYRCDTPTMNDGCQWRKYGQKISKGNPCPRAYYRCTVAPACPVRKQVQRCVDDMSVLITTYEGTHNHPLPVSATAMASTTSAAASMLMLGSSTSGQGPSASSAPTTCATSLNGLNFYLSDNSRSKPFYLPNSSFLSSPSYPTITLDLTTASSPALSHLSRVGNLPTTYSPTNLNFNSFGSNSLPVSWSNGALNNATQPLNKINQTENSLSFGTMPDETLFRSCMQKYFQNPNQQTHTPDTIAAATKAITSDPTFRSALAVALKSIIGSGLAGSTILGNQNVSEKTSQTVKPSEHFPVLSSFPSVANPSISATSFSNASSPTTSPQPRNLLFGSDTDQKNS